MVVGAVGDTEHMRRNEREQRDSRVVRLVLAGCSYRDAAAAVGLRSPASVHAIVTRELGGEDSRRELLAREADAVFIERTEAVLRANWAAALNGDYKATLTCMRVMDQQARFYGLLR